MVRLLFRIAVAVIVLSALAIAGFRMMATGRETLAVADLLTPESTLTETPHGQIHSIAIGPDDGPQVLLIHGTVGWAGFWQDTMESLAAKGYRAIAIDLPPLGLSERTLNTDYSRQAQGLRILAFVEASEIAPILVAHSVGAGAAAEALLVDADAFKGAVFVNAALALGQDGSGQQLMAPLRPAGVREALVASTVTNPYLTRRYLAYFMHRKDAITDANVAAIQYPFTRKGTTETLARWLPTLIIPPRNALSTDPGAYGDIATPVAIIWGRQDEVTPPNEAVALQQALGDAPLYWLDDVGHIPQIEAPEAFQNALANALAGLADPS
ncbi:MAG: alpha/beta hydrolase [Silicimonas sp.]|nr:alpha/beta hydrolase [Silicimonas sp.]